ncbi:NAD-dependent epimerase/dehydratase family protein, partial [Streptomyces sp. NPDC052107]|uniref:NAD-dependent epimerase/dehydratase family protein n=1 Tax=Streptomyces sp. NPDC052107 TaxID=3155632 RepID=UPI00344ACF11
MNGTRHVLVTGAAGYVGAVLVPLLLASRWQVTAVDVFHFGRDTLATSLGHPGLRVVQADARSLDSRLLDGVDAVIALAALSLVFNLGRSPDPLILVRSRDSRTAVLHASRCR